MHDMHSRWCARIVGLFVMCMKIRVLMSTACLMSKGLNVNHISTLMQRQRSSSNSNSSFNHGFDVNNHGLCHENQVIPEELNAGHGYPDANIGTAQMLEEMYSEPTDDRIMSSGLGPLGQSTLQSVTSDAVTENLDLNIAQDDSNSNTDEEVEVDSLNQTPSLEGNTNIRTRNTRRRMNPAIEQEFPNSSISSAVHAGNSSQPFQPCYQSWVTTPSSSSSSSTSPSIPASGHYVLGPNMMSLGRLPTTYSPQNGTTGVRMSVPPTSHQNLRTSVAIHRNYSSPNGATGAPLSSPPVFLRRNLPRGFQSGFMGGVHLSSTPTELHPRNVAEEYEARLTDIVSPSMMNYMVRFPGSSSGGQIGYPIPPSSHSVLQLPGNALALEAFPRHMGMMLGPEGHNDMLPPLQPFVIAPSRAELRQLVQHALELLRSIEGTSLRYEGWDDVHDEYEDMRLDVDNMSYEELLALQERIGNVSTGLSEEAILRAVTQLTYQSTRLGPPVEERCCICQDDHVDGEELGKLDCGHDFHLICIKQWLVQKNTCPFCKSTAFAI